VGAGVLGLPFAVKYLMWPGGVVVMCLSWCTSLYTLWQVRSLQKPAGTTITLSPAGGGGAG